MGVMQDISDRKGADRQLAEAQALAHVGSWEWPLVAMLTNHASDAQRARCLALGAEFFWDKSKDLGAIQEAFRVLAAR